MKTYKDWMSVETEVDRKLEIVKQFVMASQWAVNSPEGYSKKNLKGIVESNTKYAMEQIEVIKNELNFQITNPDY